jgi:ribosomal protein L11 methyltransferase
LRYLTQFLLDHPKSNPTALDLGCGSGILALASAKFGAQAIGWDLDATAIQEAQRNAKVNRLTSRVLFQTKDALRAALPKAALIVANLYDSLLLHLLPRLEKYRKTGTTLILSGILQGQENAIIRTAQKLGWKLQRRGRLGRWFCLQFQS